MARGRVVPHDDKDFLTSYWAVISETPWAALGCAVLSLFLGLFEGAALVSLVPLLQGASYMPMGRSLGWPPFAWLANLFGGGLGGGLILFLVLGCVTAFLHFATQAALFRFRMGLEERARSRMATMLAGVDWAAFHGFRQGDISQSMIAEGAHIAIGAQAFLAMIGTTVIALVFLCIAMTVSFGSTALSAVIGLCGLGLLRFAGRSAAKTSKEAAAAAGKVGEEASLVFQHLKFLRATGLEGGMMVRLLGVFSEAREAVLASLLHGARMRLVAELVAIFLVTALMALMTRAEGGATSSALALLFIFYRLTPRLLSVQEHWHQSRMALPWYRAWSRRLAQAKALRSQGLEGTALPLSAEVRLEGVSFTYPGASSPVLKDLSFAVAPSECLAIVGASGSGKSTLLDIIAGLLKPQFGELRLGGRRLEDCDLGDWRKGMGLVLQDSPVFHASVLENIAFGEDAPDSARAERAALLANAWGFIRELPGGLAEIVGEKGGRLSGGQRQRLALARALYREPRLLILDEATSALDGAAEAEVQKALAGIKGTCSILIVAHRIKTLEMADRILVLKEGQIVEQGTWSDLLKCEGGEFRAMAEAQGIHLEG